MKFFRRSNVKLQARKRRWKFFVRSVITLSCVLALTYTVRYLSLHLEKLKINSILIEGAGGKLTTGVILKASGLSVGMPIFSVDLPEVVRRLEQDPWIDRVRVSRRLPHTLLIDISRREPKLILSVGKFYYLGAHGEIFKEVEGAKDSRDFPVLTGLSREEIEQDPPRAREVFTQALKLLNAYEGQEASQPLGLSEIHYNSASGFSLFPEKARFRVIVGFEPFDGKLKRLSAALGKLKRMSQSFASIDLNYEGKVILTM